MLSSSSALLGSNNKACIVAIGQPRDGEDLPPVEMELFLCIGVLLPFCGHSAVIQLLHIGLEPFRITSCILLFKGSKVK